MQKLFIMSRIHKSCNRIEPRKNAVQFHNAQLSQWPNNTKKLLEDDSFRQ